MHLTLICANVGPATMKSIKRLIKEPLLRNSPGSRFVYSDICFIALVRWRIASAGCRSTTVCAEEPPSLPLGMKDTGFRPPEALRCR